MENYAQHSTSQPAPLIPWEPLPAYLRDADRAAVAPRSNRLIDIRRREYATAQIMKRRPYSETIEVLVAQYNMLEHTAEALYIDVYRGYHTDLATRDASLIALQLAQDFNARGQEPDCLPRLQETYIVATTKLLEAVLKSGARRNRKKRALTASAAADEREAREAIIILDKTGDEWAEQVTNSEGAPPGTLDGP